MAEPYADHPFFFSSSVTPPTLFIRPTFYPPFLLSRINLPTPSNLSFEPNHLRLPTPDIYPFSLASLPNPLFTFFVEHFTSLFPSSPLQTILSLPFIFATIHFLSIPSNLSPPFAFPSPLASSPSSINRITPVHSLHLSILLLPITVPDDHAARASVI